VGLDEKGTVEIEYGIKPECESRSLMPEAVITMTRWMTA